MRVKVRIIGLGGIDQAEQIVEFDGATLADLKNYFTQAYPDALSDDSILLAFVNGKLSAADWTETVLREGDQVLFVVPVSGG